MAAKEQWMAAKRAWGQVEDLVIARVNPRPNSNNAINEGSVGSQITILQDDRLTTVYMMTDFLCSTKLVWGLRAVNVYIMPLGRNHSISQKRRLVPCKIP